VIHPELNRILDEYNNIAENYERGAIDLADATSSIGQLQVVDGQGWVWGIDPNTGSFIRSSPGQSDPQPADPENFSPSQIPFSGSQGPSPAASPPWATPSSDPHDAWTPPPPPSRRGSPSRSPRESSRAQSSGSFFTQNRRTIIIAAVVVIVLILVLVGRKSPGTTTTSTLPPVTTTSAPTTSTTTTTIAPLSPGTPSSAEMLQDISGISQGPTSISDVTNYVWHPGTHVAIVQHVAFFSGLAAVSARVSVARATKVTGGAVSSFVWRDSTTNAVLYKGHIDWVRRGASWQMVTWPVFS
jgi:hypothetical protein